MSADHLELVAMVDRHEAELRRWKTVLAPTPQRRASPTRRKAGGGMLPALCWLAGLLSGAVLGWHGPQLLEMVALLGPWP